jgi:hypothetical protein
VIFKVGDGERVVSVARLPEESDEDGAAAAEVPVDARANNGGRQSDAGDR